MIKATSVVDEATKKRLAFAGMLVAHIGVLSDDVINRFSKNENRGEIPDRLLLAFTHQDGTVIMNEPPAPRDNTIILHWLNQCPVFCKEFGLKIEVDFEALKTDSRVTNRREGFDWPVYKPTGFTARQAINILKTFTPAFTVYEEIPVEEYTSAEVRPDKPHIVLCRAGIEPDKEWRMSANQMCATNVPFLDHTERYLLEAFHYWLYKKGLDIVGWTRMPRSRTSHGRVSSADRYGSRFKADWSIGDDADPRVGGREVVIL